MIRNLDSGENKPTDHRHAGVVYRAVLLIALFGGVTGHAQEKTTLPAPTGTEGVPATGTDPTTDLSGPGAAPGRTLKPAESTPVSGQPFRVGSFVVLPEIDVTYLYDDNVFYTNATTVSDHASIVSPAIWVQSNWAQHALNFYAASDVTRYNNYSSENTEDYRLSAEGRYDFSANSNVYGGARVSKDHEDRESPDANNGLTPTTYRQYRYYGGVFNQIDRWSVRVAGTAQRLDYRDVNFLTGSGVINIINNDDRDRWQYTGGARVGYEVSPQLEPYAQIAFDNRRYKHQPDDLGYYRDSDGERYLVGVKWNMPKTLKLDAFAGYARQDYDDPRLVDVSSPVAGAALLWSIAPRTTVSAYLDRTVEETTVSQTVGPGVVVVSSSYLNTYLSLGINHRLNDAWSVRAGGSFSRVDYQGLDREDDYYGANIGVAYRINRNLILDVDLSNRELQSSIPTEDFRKRVVFVRLAIPFSH
ncbi:MAG: hypothetical protein EHM16_10045 [Betaproteobacteria bacterium]|nr:MAG: hypothetical protein EHM16_10045 [Betaproteobacteria bacterium]